MLDGLLAEGPELPLKRDFHRNVPKAPDVEISILNSEQNEPKRSCPSAAALGIILDGANLSLFLVPRAATVSSDLLSWRKPGKNSSGFGSG